MLTRALRFSILALVAAVASPSTADAVAVSGGAHGEVLIFPLFIADTNYRTLVNVRNTASDAVAIRVVTRRGIDGAAVSTQTVFLGPNDAWPFAIREIGDGETQLATRDPSCVVSPGEANNDAFLFAVDGDSPHGWIEVYELGALTAQQADAYLADVYMDDGDAVCDAAIGAENITLQPRRGALSGESYLVDVERGLSFSIPPVGLVDFGAPAQVPAMDGASPTLADAAPVAEVGGQQFEFASGIDAVSAAISTHTITTAFAAEPAVNGRTDVVLTFPTRPFYEGDDAAPFNKNTTEDFDEQGQQMDLEMFTREGQPFEEAGLRRPPSKCSPNPPSDPDYRGPIVSQAQSALYFQEEPLLPIADSEEASFYGNMWWESCSGNFNFTVSQADDPRMATGQAKLTFGDFQLTGAANDTTASISGLPVLAVSLSLVANGTLIGESGQRLLANYGLMNTVTTTQQVQSDNTDG